MPNQTYLVSFVYVCVLVTERLTQYLVHSYNIRSSAVFVKLHV